jgi:hypothetical protein
MSQFEQPAEPSAGLEWGDLLGSLLIIDVHEVVRGVMTTFGPKDPVRADIRVVDGPHAGDEHLDTLIFPVVLVSQTAPMVGKKVLGRLGQGQGKPGQKPPWRLADATPEDAVKATEFLTSQPATLTDPF